MAIITFPETLYMTRMSWGQQRNDITSRSVFGAQAVEASAPVWIVSLDIDRVNEGEESGEWKSLLMRLKGQTNQLALWDFGRPVPRGTMRGSMVLNADAAQSATTLSITAGSGQASKTLLEGDLLGLGSGVTQQVFMVVADATANGSGVISVTVEPPLRNAFLSGETVTWDKPKALFRRTSSIAQWDYSGVYASGFGLDLIEDWRE